MIQLGKTNSLRVIKSGNTGITLDGEDLGEIFIPKKEIQGRPKVDDILDVFVYVGPKDELTATARKPYAEAGQFALLKAVTCNSYGAFLDWGLEQDLRVSSKEQNKPMKSGQSYIVYVYNEKNDRITASAKLDKFIKTQQTDFKEGRKVDLIIGDITPMGYRAIINKTYLGMLFKNEVFQILKRGQAIKGYVKNIREDGKIDLCLQKTGAKETDELSKKILDMLKENGGRLNISDKSSPEKIYDMFKVSKKRYKSVLGALYKKRLIVIDKFAIRLTESQGRDTLTADGKKPARMPRRIKVRK